MSWRTPQGARSGGVTMDMHKKMSVNQGYVPATCTLPGPIVWGLVTRGEDPCAGCNADRGVCHGRPKRAAEGREE